MNRRDVLKGMLSLAAGGALVACRKHGQPPTPENPPEDKPQGPTRPVQAQPTAAPAATPAAPKAN